MTLLPRAENGWLVPPAQRKLTPDRYHQGHRPERLEPIEAAIWHFGVAGSKTGMVRWLTRRDKHYVSAHFVIGRDGAITQLAPLTDRCIHAGGETSKLFKRGGVNNRTVGIELENWGPLARGPGGRLLNAYGDPTGSEVRGVVEAEGKLWDAYTDELLDAACELAQALAVAVPVLADPKRHLGHNVVDRNRKIDPGPHFPWERIHAAVGGAPMPAGDHLPRGCRLV